MSREEPLTAARRFVADCFAGARWAVLSGSVVAGNATPGSDLDIVILLPDGDIRPPFRASRIFAGWPVEMLVYDEKSLRHYLA